MKKGNTPKDIRSANCSAILEQLKTQPYTLTKLAKTLNLSLTSIHSCCRELESKHIVETFYPTVNVTAGRPSLSVRLSSSIYFLLILFSEADNAPAIVFHLVSSQGNIIDSITSVNYSKRQINDINNTFETNINLLFEKNNITSSNILLTCISIPGIVNETTNVIVATSLQEQHGLYDLKDFLSKKFNFQIIIRNTMQYVTHGELSKGNYLNESGTHCLMEIREYSIINFVINGKVYTGSNGYAGEVGFVTNDVENEVIDNLDERAKKSLDEYISFYSIIEKVKKHVSNNGDKYLIDSKDISLSTVAELYRNNDLEVVKIVDYQLNNLTNFIINLSILFDLKNIVLIGKITYFGDEYLKKLNSKLKLLAPYTPRAYFSSLKTEDACLCGMIDDALSYTVSTINN